MELNRLAFAAYQRTPWQVFDLTQLFVRSNMLSLLKIYLAFSLPFAIVLLLLLDADIAIFVLWWLKPLFERPLLDYLSKRSFSQATSVWGSIKSLKQLAFVDVLMMLTINRFSLNRAYLSPVTQLENQKGKAHKSRCTLLLGRCEHKQPLWIIFCLHLEGFVMLLLTLSMLALIPDGFIQDDQFVMDSVMSGAFDDIYYVFYYISTLVIAPYFVTGGFLMYLNCRIKLEGWDIELTFKRIASKFAVFFAITMLSFMTVIDEHKTMAYEYTESAIEENSAAETESEVDSVQATTIEPELLIIREEIDKIYQDNELIIKESTWTPKKKEEGKVDNWFIDFLASMFEFLSALSPALSYLIWGIILFLAFLVAKWLYDNRDRWKIKRTADNKPIRADMVLPDVFTDIEPESWPDDLLSAAQQANQKQQYRQALMFILKYSLLYADENAPLLLNSSMTENECQRALMKVLPKELHAQYQSLFSLWIQQAWAHRNPSSEDVQVLIESFRALENKPSEQTS